jgi:hypothetical protein
MPTPLLHFSEDPGISVFAPHVAPTAEETDPLVWAVDEAHQPSYWFPRNCPRACCWDNGTPLTEAGRALIGTSRGRRMHAIEDAWLERMHACKLFVYRFDPKPFVQHDAPGGFWVSRETVKPLSVEPVGDLFEHHKAAGIDLRVVDDFGAMADAIVASGLGFSIIRRRNARTRVP